MTHPAVPRVLVVTGPSGVGKGTLIRELLRERPELRLSVSATTRPPRSGERDGLDYHFLSPEEFDRRVHDGDFLEHATYAGNRYGTLREEVDRAPYGIVLEIETDGARQVRKTLPEAMQVFIAPPSVETLRERLMARGTDSPDQIRERLAHATAELREKDRFPHVITNDRLDRAAAELIGLVATMWPRTNGEGTS